jgi:hypothetical protein
MIAPETETRAESGRQATHAGGAAHLGTPDIGSPFCVKMRVINTKTSNTKSGPCGNVI